MVEGDGGRSRSSGQIEKKNTNPFNSFASVPGRETERFALFDISGRRVGTYRGERVGGLLPQYQEMLKQVQHD